VVEVGTLVVVDAGMLEATEAGEGRAVIGTCSEIGAVEGCT